MRNKKLLIIGHVWPEPRSSAAGSRMMQLIAAFNKESFEIIFASACAKSDNAFDLSAIGVSQVSIEMNHSSFDDFIVEFQPDVVLFDRFMTEEQFGWRVAETCPNALRILDTEDLHSLRKGRQQAFKEQAEFNDAYLFNDFAKREIASIYRSDLSLIISEVEINLLTDRFKVPNELLFYLPFQCEAISENTIQNLPTFDKRSHFITVGNFLHEPNYDSVLYLKETIWPLVRQKIPTAELHIYGAYASQKVTQLHNKLTGFFIKGFATDVNEVMANSKICLAPLRFGAGLKGKLVDAMQNGTPCVMTSIAAEGMFGNLDTNGFIENDPEQFAEKAVFLYENEHIWKEKQSFGFKVFNARFDANFFHERFFQKVYATIQNLQNHRNYNFTGQMLQHHTLQSTKYMGKWIEAKNK